MMIGCGRAGEPAQPPHGEPVTDKPISSLPPLEPTSNRLSGAPSASVKPPASSPPPDEAIDSLTALRSFVDPDELSVVFQPIVSLRRRELYAYEALVRCSVPELRAPPVLFDKAVDNGCTGRLGRMIREIGVPLAAGLPLFVNIHPRELSEGWLIQPDDPVFGHDDDVFLEVTESVPLSHSDLCSGVLKEVCTRGGVHLVVDDLGAGYSNLKHIADLEPAIVKLDRQLVAGIDHNRRQRELVSAVVDLCVRLGAEVVAEGIETPEECRAVIDTGAHYGQGYLFARPAFPAPLVQWPGDEKPTDPPPATERSD